MVGTCLSLDVLGVKSEFKTEYLQEATKINEEMRLRERTIESQLNKETAV